MEIHFFMPMDPPTITHQEKSIKSVKGRLVVYEPQKLKNARQKLTDHLVPNRPAQKVTGPIELVVTWCFPTHDPNLYSKYRTTPPDTDNLNKMLKDCMTRLGFWEDDAQVCREIIEKFWTDSQQSGIYIRIRQL